MSLKYNISAVFLTLSFYQALVAEESDSEKYRHCMGLTETDPPAAMAYANDWFYGGTGRVPAEHCKALALLATGDATAAARLLEKLVDDLNLVRPPQNRPDLQHQLYMQAGLAWTTATEYDRAYNAYNAALALLSRDKTDDPDPVLRYELYLERGIVETLRGRYRAAIADFTRAIEQNPQAGEVFLQRAMAYRKSHHFPAARLDLKMAHTLAVDPLALLLESGILYQKVGDQAQARITWQKVITMAPESEDAALARAYMADLDQD